MALVLALAAGSGPTQQTRSELRTRSERHLTKEANGGSAEAAGELVRRHWPNAHRAAYLITRDAAAAEDITQESMLAALGALERFDGRRAFRPWLHRIVANRSIDWLRARERRGEVAIDQARESADELDPPDVAGILSAISELDPRTRAMVVMRCLLEYRPREIAEMFELSPGAVRTQLHRALASVRETADTEVNQ